MGNFRSSLVNSAKRDEGEGEEGGNDRGAFVDALFAFDPTKQGAWCAAWLSQKLIGAGLMNENKPLVWVPDLKSYFIDHHALEAATQENAQPGDLFFVNRSGGSGLHVGMIVKVFPNGTVQTIEGNVNDGTTELDRIMFTTRNISDLNSIGDVEKLRDDLRSRNASIELPAELTGLANIQMAEANVRDLSELPSQSTPTGSPDPNRTQIG